MKRHIQTVFSGEYEVPLFGSHYDILDIGANVGAFSLWASHRFPFSTTFAFEPNPDCLPYLEENLKNSPVVIHKHGLGKEGVRPLFNGRSNLGEASLHTNINGGETGKHVEIKDPLTLPEADIVKVDTEGAELEILTPLINHGRTFRAILLEFHSATDRRAIDALLKDYILTGSHVFHHNRGVCRYLHKSEVPS